MLKFSHSHHHRLHRSINRMHSCTIDITYSSFVNQNNMTTRVGDKLNLYECLQFKVEEIKPSSNSYSYWLLLLSSLTQLSFFCKCSTNFGFIRALCTLFHGITHWFLYCLLTVNSRYLLSFNLVAYLSCMLSGKCNQSWMAKVHFYSAVFNGWQSSASVQHLLQLRVAV